MSIQSVLQKRKSELHRGWQTTYCRTTSALKQYLGNRSHLALAKRERRMRLIETLQLGNRRQLTLIVCDGNHFLVGCGADSVHSVVPLPPSPLEKE